MNQQSLSAINGVSFEFNRAIIDNQIITPEKLTAGLIKSLFDIKKNVVYELDKKVGYCIYASNGNYAMIGEVNNITVCYLNYDGINEDNGRPGYYVYADSYYPPEAIDVAIKSFLSRVSSVDINGVGNDENEFPGYKLEDIHIMQHGIVTTCNHYTYLDYMLEGFCKEVFNKTPIDMCCYGIVGAHGDKCYGYKSDWEEVGIPFNRGTMLYLLTYTPAFAGNEKSRSCEWVIENYQKYLPMLEKVEKEVMESKFTYKKE